MIDLVCRQLSAVNSARPIAGNHETAYGRIVVDRRQRLLACPAGGQPVQIEDAGLRPSDEQLLVIGDHA
jgi:hypothetical protein